MIEFKFAAHTKKHTDVVEVWVNGRMVAAIYPNGNDGIRLLSRHVKSIDKESIAGLTDVKLQFEFKVHS